MRNGTAGPSMPTASRAPLAWRVLGFTSDAAGAMVRLRVGGMWAECGHNHDTQAEAEACPWEPTPAPTTYAGLVRQVRADHRQVQGAMPW